MADVRHELGLGCGDEPEGGSSGQADRAVGP